MSSVLNRTGTKEVNSNAMRFRIFWIRKFAATSLKGQYHLERQHTRSNTFATLQQLQIIVTFNFCIGASDKNAKFDQIAHFPVRSAHELWSNKDLIHSISTFMSLKQLNNFRKVCKQYYSWLSDAAGFAWNQRIKSSFPFSFQSVLKEDMKSQIARLREFDTLVEEGNQVSLFEWPELADRPFYPECVALVPPHIYYSMQQRPHMRIQFYNGSSQFSSHICNAMYSINVRFSQIDHKIGLVTREVGVMSLFAVEGMTLKHEADFSSDVFRSCVVNHIYGDYVEWYSLTTNKLVKTMKFSDYEKTHVASSQREPRIYVSESFEQSYRIWQVDGNVNSETPQKILFERNDKSRIHRREGVELLLSEMDHGRVLYTSFCDFFYDVFDLDSGQLTHVDKVERLFERFEPNPGTPFYTLYFSSREESREFLILDDKFHDDWLNAVWTDRTARTYRLLHGMSGDSDEERTRGTFFSFFNVEVMRAASRWLSSDILTLRIPTQKSGRFRREYFFRQLFFSIKNRRVIGYIDDDIGDICTYKNQVFAFSTSGIYRITWNPELVPTF